MADESGGGGVLRELLAVFGFGVDSSELEKGENRLDAFLEKVKGVAEKVAAAFAVEQIYEFAESQAHAMNAIERTGRQLGITTDRVQEFQFAAKSLGMEADQLLNLMGRLQVTQQAAAAGGAAQAKVFHDLGTSVRDSNGHMKSADELMLDVADGISKMSDPSKQAAAAVQLFGRAGREILPFLKEGRAGAEEYFATFRETGGGYTEEALKAGKDFDKQQAKTALSLTGVKNVIAKALLPIVTQISKGVQVAAQWFAHLAKNSNIVQATLIALGSVATVFAIEMAIAFAPVLLAAAAVAVLILAIDDLYTFLTGGDSAIGDLIDKIFGEGAQVSALKGIRDGWDSIKETFKSLVPYVRDVVDGFKWIVDHTEQLGGLIGKGVAKVTLQNPDDVLGDKSKKPITKEQREAVTKKMHAQQAAQLASGASLEPGYMGPLNQPVVTPILPPVPGTPGGGGDVHIENINVPPGMDPKQAGEHVGREVREAMKQERRAAAATLPRAGN